LPIITAGGRHGGSFFRPEFAATAFIRDAGLRAMNDRRRQSGLFHQHLIDELL
jgi:hypothetical protein